LPERPKEASSRRFLVFLFLFLFFFFYLFFYLFFFFFLSFYHIFSYFPFLFVPFPFRTQDEISCASLHPFPLHQCPPDKARGHLDAGSLSSTSLCFCLFSTFSLTFPLSPSLSPFLLFLSHFFKKKKKKKENRSFDHFLGWLKRENPEINGLTGKECNFVNASDPTSDEVFLFLLLPSPSPSPSP